MLSLPPPVDGRIVFVDTEFTTLDRRRRQVWEIAVIIRDPGAPDLEVEWQVRPNLIDASPDSLRIGRYYRRCLIQDRPVGTGVLIVGPGHPELKPKAGKAVDWARVTTAEAIAAQLAPTLDGAFLVGAVVSADELVLDGFLRDHGQALPHHYRIRCVETLTLGYLHGRRQERAEQLGPDAPVLEVPGPPWDTKELTRLAGCELPPADLAHRALVDARWARDLWDRVHQTVGVVPDAAAVGKSQLVSRPT